MRVVNDHTYWPDQLKDLRAIHPETGQNVFDSLIDDLRAELGQAAGPRAAVDMETVREVAIEPSFRPVTLRVVDNWIRNSVVVVWAIPLPLGGEELLEARLPEDVRAQLRSTEIQGDAMIDALRDYTLPQAQARFDELWADLLEP